ncbi:MAG: DUF4476 domain-containing protein [Ignavibacteria bacterium]|nr:DUF4476 domain-containing protein [Ignavibacteria bacterium]
MKIIKAIVFFILTGIVYSQSAFLEISLYDGGEFRIVFDNQEFSWGNYASFDNISAGEHYIKIEKEGVNVPPQGNIIFEGKVKIPAGSDSYAVINEYGEFLIYRKLPYMKDRIDCETRSRRRCGSDTKKESDNKQSEISNDCRYKVIKNDDFDALRKSINNRNFENTNIDILKSAIDKNYFTSQQIKTLLGYFSSEDNRLEIAKYSYKKVCDRNNFSVVFEAFSFDSSIKELKNYISDK